MASVRKCAFIFAINNGLWQYNAPIWLRCDVLFLRGERSENISLVENSFMREINGNGKKNCLFK